MNFFEDSFGITQDTDLLFSKTLKILEQAKMNRLNSAVADLELEAPFKAIQYLIREYMQPVLSQPIEKQILKKLTDIANQIPERSRYEIIGKLFLDEIGEIVD